MSRNKGSTPWWARSAMLAAALCAIVFGAWTFFSPSVPHRNSRQLRKGMNTAEVLALIGKPYQVISDAEGSSEWIYGSPLKRSRLRIGFSREERMTDFRQEEHGIRKIEGACYWGVAWAYDQVGATDEAEVMSHRSMCASMGWENLRFSCKNQADAVQMKVEVWKFFKAQGHLIPNCDASIWSTDDPVVFNVVVSEPEGKAPLEDYLRERGYIAE